MLRHLLLTTACGAALVAPGRAAAAAEPHRSFYDLPSSNGWGAVVVDLSRGRAHHWRDHLFATEEPRIDAAGAEVWSGDLPESVAARDLLFDAYFGLRADGQQQWLTDLPVDLEASGWVPGTNLVQMRQQLGDLALTTTAWAPWELPRSAAALVLTVENTGSVPVAGLSAFSLQNLHLGEGRPGPTSETGAQNETVVLDEGSGHIEERGFAGVVSTWPLRQPAAVSAWYPGAPTPNPWEVVQGGGAVDFVAGAGDQGVHDDSVSYIRWDHGPLAPGEVARFGLVMAHHGDPFSVAALSAEVQAWIAGREPGAVLADEEAAWQAFQGAVVVPAALTPDEEALYRHSAVVLRMAQVRETEAYLRQWLRSDGEPRYSAFGGPLPSVVPHKAAGGVLASLPPGQWTYAWPRDGAYAVVGMAYAGMQGEAREALRYLLDADTDRYRTYQELAGVPVLPYSISLCRHHGFGIEESDTLGGGDFNFEFDGAGLFLWALDHYGRATGDWSLLQERWEPIRDRVAAFLVALIDPVSGLIHEDSSIWEHHWLGKERTWAYTSITAARGLCAAADFADRQGETALAEAWRGDATRIRDGLLASLQAPDRSIAQTREELAAGAGYADGAVIEAVAMGLLDPAGAVGPATLQALVDALQTDDGPGLSRNDDAWDPHDLSPWGSSYDSDEWVVIDLRTAVAARDLGDPILADALVDWITDQSTSNFLAIGETYDPVTGDYTNNAPMVGFGAGAYIAALNHRAGVLVEGPACGEFPAEPLPGDDDEPTDDDDAVSPTGCGCAAGAARPGAAGLLVLVMLLGLSLRRARC